MSAAGNGDYTQAASGENVAKPCSVRECPNPALHRVLFMNKSAGPTYDHLDLCARHGHVTSGSYYPLDTDPQRVWDHFFGADIGRGQS